MIRSRTFRAAAFALPLALVAVACGSDDDGDAADTTEAAADTTAAPAETTAAPAETTAAPDTSAAAEETTTTEAAAPAFEVPTDNCPADVNEPLADGDPIKVGFIGPQTGPLAAFGLIGVGMQVRAQEINAAGGIGGHELEIVIKDDAYDPAKSKTAVQEAIQSDKIFVSLLQVGTPNVAGTREDYAAACVPQAYVGTGFPAWGDPANFPWTVGGIPAYNTEANLWIEYLKETNPGAKIAQVVYNNDFGKAYQKQVEAIAEENGFEIVETVLHEPTSDLTNEVTTVLAAGADVILGETTAQFCTNLIVKARQGGFEGPIVLSATCNSSQFLEPAAEAAVNVFGVSAQKDPADPQWEGDEGMDAYKAAMAEYAADQNANISSFLTGYSLLTLLAENLETAAGAEAGLTRAALMNAIWSTDTVLPLGLPDSTVKLDGNSDGYTSEFGAIRTWDPATKSLTDTGFTVDLEGATGLYTPS